MTRANDYSPLRPQGEEMRELQAVTPAFGHCAGCGEPCALDPDGHALCLDCERTIGKGEVSWSAK